MERDVPQSVDTIDKKELAEQNLSLLQDALRNVPGVTLNSGEGEGAWGFVNLRGCPFRIVSFGWGARHRSVPAGYVQYGGDLGAAGSGVRGVRPRVDFGSHQQHQQAAAADALGGAQCPRDRRDYQGEDWGF